MEERLPSPQSSGHDVVAHRGSGQDGQKSKSLSTILKDASSSLIKILQSETHLVRAQLELNAKTVTHKITEAFLFIAVTGLGAIALLFSAMWALGNFWNQRYDLSALSIGLILFIPGIFFTIQSVKSIKKGEQ